jgi:hypothetical protein
MQTLPFTMPLLSLKKGLVLHYLVLPESFPLRGKRTSKMSISARFLLVAQLFPENEKKTSKERVYEQHIREM